MAVGISRTATGGIKRALPDNDLSDGFKRQKIQGLETVVEESDNEDDDASTVSSRDSIKDFAEDTPLTPLSPATTPSHRSREKSLSQPPCRIANLPCPYDSCNKLFNRRSRLEEHIRSHTNDRPFICTFDPATCDKTFLRQSHLTAHVKSAHTKAREFVCTFKLDPDDLQEIECGKAFATATKLRRHEKSHADGNARYRCTEHPPCKETFRKRSTLAAHVKSTHLGVKPFVCDSIDARGNVCGAGYDTAFKLRAHERRVHSDETPHQCLICSSNTGSEPQRFKTQQELAQHTMAVHPPTCVDCDMQFSTFSALSLHRQAIHHEQTEQDSMSKRKTHDCTYTDCGKAFTTASNLRVHIRTAHERAKPFICGTTDLSTSKGLSTWDGHGCGGTFGVKASLEKHVRVRHLGLPDPGLVRRRKQQSSATSPTSLAEHHTHSTNQSLDAELTARIDALEGDTQDPQDPISTLLNDDYATRPHTCLSNCSYRFTRVYDLKMHCRLYHDMSESEIDEMLVEREALGGGVFWIGGLDESQFDSTFDGVDLFADEDPSASNDLSAATTSLPSGIADQNSIDEAQAARDALNFHELQDHESNSGQSGEEVLDPLLFTATE